MDPDLIGAVMGTYHELSIRGDDRDGLVSMYGERCRQLERWMPDATFNSWTFSTRYNVCSQSRPQGAGLWFTGHTIFGVKIGALVASAADVFNGFSYDHPQAFASSVHPPAIARGSSEDDLLAVWANRYEEDTGANSCAIANVAVSHDGGDTWTLTQHGGSTFNHCIDSAPSVAYDAATGIYIVFFNGGPQYVTYDVNGNQVHEATIGDRLFAVHTPTIACAPIFDNDRCLLMYDRNDAYGCLAFRKARGHTDGTVSWGGETVQCFSQENTPALMFRQNEATYPWAMLFKQTSTLFSMIKTYGGTSWTQTRVVVNDPANGVSSGGFGQVQSGGTYAPYSYVGRLP